MGPQTARGDSRSVEWQCWLTWSLWVTEALRFEVALNVKSGAWHIAKIIFQGACTSVSITLLTGNDLWAPLFYKGKADYIGWRVFTQSGSVQDCGATVTKFYSFNNRTKTPSKAGVTASALNGSLKCSDNRQIDTPLPNNLLSKIFTSARRKAFRYSHNPLFYGVFLIWARYLLHLKCTLITTGEKSDV